MELSIGRIVHYTPQRNTIAAVDQTICAAIVTAVYPNGVVDLTFFPPGQQPQFANKVKPAEGGVPGEFTWHWPLRV